MGSWVSDAADWMDTSSNSGILDNAFDLGETWLNSDTEKYKARQSAKAEVAKANAYATIANGITKNIFIISAVIIVAIILKD